MTPEKWAGTCGYVGEVFGGLGEPLDAQLETLMDRAVAAGLPSLAVSADVGRLLMVLVRMACSGSDRPRAVEVGALGGYSGLWLARGLGERGRLITIEPEPKHAAFSRGEFARAGGDGRVELRESTGLEELPRLVEELGEGSVDVVFLDAIKSEYRGYADHAARLLRPGGLLIADNCLGSSWWITDEPGTDEGRDAVDAFNRWIGTSQSGFLSCCLANREGLVVAQKAAARSQEL